MEYPYTFVAGTKAVANEVNSNFEAVGNQVDTNTTNITDLQNNKADLSLSNLNETGLDAFANKDADNFTTTGTTYLSGLGMPSSRYINLTLGSSGSTYTAPANGWVALGKSSGGSGNYILFDTSNYTLIEIQSNYPLRLLAPVRKGQQYKIEYTASGTTLFFRFIYAEGTPSA